MIGGGLKCGKVGGGVQGNGCLGEGGVVSGSILGDGAGCFGGGWDAIGC